MGTAKPVWCSPLPVPATLIPIAWPDRFTSGPPVSSPATTRAVDTSRPVSRWPPAATAPVPLVRFPMSSVKVLVSPALPTAVTASPRLRYREFPTAIGLNAGPPRICSRPRS